MQIFSARNLAVLASLATVGLVALRAREQERLVGLADEITTDLARLEAMPAAAKRQEALRRLYDQAPAHARRLLDANHFARAVELAWHFHAKPRLYN
jgi:hypothetical protein